MLEILFNFIYIEDGQLVSEVKKDCEDNLKKGLIYLKFKDNYLLFTNESIIFARNFP